MAQDLITAWAVAPAVSLRNRHRGDRGLSTGSGFGRLICKAPVFAIFAIIAITLTACSPYVYEKEVAKFSDGVTALVEADKAVKIQLQADRQTVNRFVWAQRKNSKLTVYRCTKTTKGCTLKDREPTAQEQGWNAGRAQIDAGKTNSDTTTNALGVYAKSLKAITNAEDNAALTGAQTEFKAALLGFAGTAGADAATNELDALANLFATVTAAALNHARFQTLKEAVTTAHNEVEVLGGALGKELNRLRNARITELSNLAEQMAIGLRGVSSQKVYLERYDALSAVIAQIATLQNQDGVKLGNAMTAAHKKLRDAFADNSRQTGAVFAAAQDFYKNAKALADAFGA